MVEHEVCEKCKWNNYPTCKGTIMDNGNEMNIKDLRDEFQCGQKDRLEIDDSSVKTKSELEIRIEEVEAKIAELEAKTAETI